MTHKTQPTAHAEITAPFSADLRRMAALSEQDAGLLEQAASMLEGLQNDERNRGNCSTAEGAACSAHAVRRLAVQLLQFAPPAPAAVAVPAVAMTPSEIGEIASAWIHPGQSVALAAVRDIVEAVLHRLRGKIEIRESAIRAALAAAPAQAQDDRAAFKAYLQECDDCEIVPDVAGAFHAAWQKRAAPAQAVASSITIDFKQAAELLEMFGGEPAEITLMMGDGHSGNGLYASYTDMPEEGAGFLGKPDNEALPAAPAQEHATQLAGQGQEPIAIVTRFHDHGGEIEWTGRVIAPVGAKLYASPAQAQEDARDALTLEELDQLDRAIEHFVEGEDTDVDWRLLTRAASLGYLRCERFTVPPTARAAIDAARAAQGGDKP